MKHWVVGFGTDVLTYIVQKNVHNIKGNWFKI